MALEIYCCCQSASGCAEV